MTTAASKLDLLEHIAKYVHLEPWKQVPATLADLIFNELPYRHGTTFLAIQKQLTDIIIINYAGRPNTFVDSTDVVFVETKIAEWFKGEIATRRATSPAQEEPSQRNNDVPKIRPQLPFVIFASSCANFLGLLLSPTLRIQASLRDAGPTGSGTRR